MERRFVVTLLLAVVAFVVATVFFGQKPPAKSPPATPTDAAADAPGGPAPANPAPAAPPGAPGAPNPPAPAGPPSPPRPQSAPHKAVELLPPSGEFKSVGFTTRGGAITHVTLRNAYETAARDVPSGQTRWPLDVIVPVDLDRLTGMVILGETDEVERMETTDWTIDAQTDSRIEFSFLTTTGLRVRKSFSVPTEEDRFDLEMSIALERVGEAAKTDEKKPEEKASLWILGVAGVMREPHVSTAMSPRGTDSGVVVYTHVLGTSDEPLEGSWSMPRVNLARKQEEDRSFRLAAVGTDYFLAAIWSAGRADRTTDAPLVKAIEIYGGDAELKLGRDDTVRGRAGVDAAYDRLKAWSASRGRSAEDDASLRSRFDAAARVFPRAWVKFETPVAPAGGPKEGEKKASAARSTFRLYVGPLSRRVLSRDRYTSTLGVLITYPAAPDFVARFLLWIFDLWRGLLDSAGVAILLMTLTVRGGLMPLSIRNQLSMRKYGRKMSKLKPQIDRLRQQYADNPKKLREQQVKLQREHGIGFPTGCLMMFVQLPIFFALFSSLRVEYDIRHGAFGWITDLAGPDRVVDFGRNVLSFVGDMVPPGGLNGINLLPLVYIVLTIWQQKLMPPPTDPQQAQSMKMAKWMSIIFSVLLYNYTAALALYMCVSSLVAIVESRIVRARDQATA